MNWAWPNTRRSFRRVIAGGVEAQVDWYEAYADLDGERVLQVFSMRSMATERPSIGRIVDASVVLIPEHSEATQLPSVPRSTAYTGVIQ